MQIFRYAEFNNVTFEKELKGFELLEGDPLQMYMLELAGGKNKVITQLNKGESWTTAKI